MGLSIVHLMLGTTHRNAGTYVFAVGAFVFILGGVGLVMIELLRLLVRRLEAVRIQRKEREPGLESVLHMGFEHPEFRTRMRIMRIVVAAFGLTALIALLVNKA